VCGFRNKLNYPDMHLFSADEIESSGERSLPGEGRALISECYQRSVALLKENAGPYGIVASSECEKAVCRNYTSVFARDAGMAALGMTASGDPELIAAVRAGLLTLVRHQGLNGQIPNFVKPDLGEVDFWYLGCVDATLWWLIAVAFYRHSAPCGVISDEFQPGVEKALRWLMSQEHQGLFLLQQNEASDWADVMPRSGFVLYSNALWYLVKSLYRPDSAAGTKANFNEIFFPFGDVLPDERRAQVLTRHARNDARRRDLYLSFLSLSGWGDEGDVFGNILALLCGLPDASERQRMADILIRENVSEPFPVRVVLDPLDESNSWWRPYMLRHNQNLPHQYHNGGIWPFVGGFWVILLGGLGKKELAAEELFRLAVLNRVNDWQFNEWFHGKTGEAMGMPGQSWNAAMFILAFHMLQSDADFFPFPGL